MRGVVIFGMGRSGTSSVTRMFQRSGYFLGAPEDLMVGDPSNPTGYFENLKVWRANESVLAHFGATWFDPPDEDEQLARSGQLQPGLRCVLDELLAQAAVTQRPLALKDPRMGVLMPLWWPLLADLLHPVLVIRDPFEIALSLERRDATAVPVALAMWEVNITRTLKQLNGQLVTSIGYRDLLQDETLAKRIVDEISTRLTPVARMPISDLASSAFERGLYRNRADAAGARWLTPAQTRLYRFLGSLPSGTCRLRSPAWAMMTTDHALRLTGYENHRQRRLVEMNAELAMAAREASHGAQKLQELESELADNRRQLEKALAHSAGCESLAEEERRHREEAGHKLNAVECQLASLRRSRSQRITAPLRTLAKTLRRVRGLAVRPGSAASETEQ